MPANLEQLYSALQAISRSVRSQSEAQRASQDAALRFLHLCASRPAALREQVEGIANGPDPNIRCAVPTSESFDSGYAPASVAQPVTLLAVDGSQVTPDRHEELLYGMINVAHVTIAAGSGRAPEIGVESKLLFASDLYPENGSLLSEGDIALMRDSAERAMLLQQSRASQGPVIALADGPLELWGGKDVTDPGAFEHALTEYLASLRLLETTGITVAGYVDKPGADLVVRLLEIDQAGPDNLQRLRSFHPLRSVSDRWLFGRLLRPGERSAIFALQSKSRARYTESLAIHFFYLNVGSERHPAISRLEIPKWVVDRRGSIDALHSAVLEQCRILGARPYPYILHRAHESARISSDEKEQIKLRLLLELRAAGVEPEDPSGKSSAKQLSGKRGRY